jgi:DNA-binding FrmR family transcriptional regulator
VRNSLTTVEGKIVKTHLKECVKDALKDKKNFDDKVEEVLKVIKR